MTRGVYQRRLRDPLARFAEKIELAANGCWLWTAATDKDGYGKFSIGGHDGGWTRSYRWSYEHFRGPIPAGLVPDHLCRTPRCVNPWCLEVVTFGTNVLRGESPTAQNAKKTACPAGHPYTIENGERVCIPCRREYQRAYYRDVRAGRRVRMPRTLS